MKRKSLLLVALIAGSFAACNKDVRTIKPGKLSGLDKNLVNVVSYFADHHNEGLDFVYDQLRKRQDGMSAVARTSYAPPFAPPMRFPMTGLAATIPMFSGLYVRTTFMNELDDKRIVDSFAVPLNLSFDHQAFFLSDYLTTVCERKFSPRLSAAIDSVHLLIENAIATSKDFIYFDIEALLINNISLLTNTLEKVILTAIARVGGSSYMYWKKSANLNKWLTLVQDAYSDSAIVLTANNETVKDIIFSDIVGAGIGAVKGAIKGAIAGSITVPGVGTISGAAGAGLLGMLSGTVSASAGAGFWGVFKKWVHWSSVPLPPGAQAQKRVKNGLEYIFIKPIGVPRITYTVLPL